MRVAVIPGDGVGQEVIPAALRVLDPVSQLDFEELPWGAEYYERTGRMMPEDGLQQLARYDAVYLGAMAENSHVFETDDVGEVGGQATSWVGRLIRTAPGILGASVGLRQGGGNGRRSRWRGLGRGRHGAPALGRSGRQPGCGSRSRSGGGRPCTRQRSAGASCGRAQATELAGEVGTVL